jgi:1-acyl-sn-glycerol-3-phosphate acyltransferase
MSEEKLASMKEQVYFDERPKEYFDQFHERSRTRKPDPVYEAVRIATSLYAWTFFRMRSIYADKVPKSGPVILAPNHFSFMDHFFVGAGIRRKVQFMAKSQLFSGPLQWIYTHGGVFPIRRGARDDEAFVTAHNILDRGGLIVMYCEGGRSRTGKLSDTAKPGIGRLALESGVPVVPTAIYGSSKVRNWKRGEFPQVTVMYGDPIRYEKVAEPTRNQRQAAADEIFDEIKAVYAQLEHYGRKGAIARAREELRAARQSARAARA